MRNALIGHTGFVGGALARQATFEATFNRANIGALREGGYDLLVCSGAPAAKWVANREPEEDLANLRGLMDNLRGVEARHFVLISTVDVYQKPLDVDEDTPIDPQTTDPYGRHRFLLEEFVREEFPDALIVRLPGLFGKGLKKNFIYDVLNDNALDYTHRDSVFQWYDTGRIWADLQTLDGSGLRLVNFATEPVSVADLAREAFGIEFTNETERPAARYDMHTLHAGAFGKAGPYMIERDEVLSGAKAYVASERGA